MTQILGYNVYNKSKKDLIEEVVQIDGKINIVSGNPEVLYNGLQDKVLYQCFNRKNTIIIPDGAGVVHTARLLKQPVKEKIAGIEVMEGIIEYCAANEKGIFLLGAEQNVVESCMLNLMDKYPTLKICGIHNGFFDLDDCQSLIDKINKSKPFALFVAMGSPRQDKFIMKYMDILEVKIFMGVGGSFDIFGGKLNRAPKWMIKSNLEWLYRVIKEPVRIKRLNSIPKFMYLAVKENKKSNK